MKSGIFSSYTGHYLGAKQTPDSTNQELRAKNHRKKQRRFDLPLTFDRQRANVPPKSGDKLNGARRHRDCLRICGCVPPCGPE
jgi:hypothetical protein